MKARLEVWLALGFVVLGIALVLSRLLLSAEGMLTYLGAKGVATVPLAAFFFQKFHPAVSLIGAPGAALGFVPFLVVSVTLAATAIVLVGATSRRWFGGGGAFAGLMLATSPLYFLSAATGQSNTSAIFLLALALWLADGSERRSLLAGLVAGFALWGRYEQVLYLGAFAAYQVLYLRNTRFAAGFAAFPVLYCLGGAAYHGDILWVLHYPPVLLQEIGPSTIPEMESTIGVLSMQLSTLLHVSPLMLVPLCLRGGADVSKHLKWGAALVGGAILVQAVPPLVGGFFNYDFSPRYFLNHLVPCAFVAAGTWAQLSGPPASVDAKRPARPSPVPFVALALGVFLLSGINQHPELVYFAPFLALPCALAFAPSRLRGVIAAVTVGVGFWVSFASPMATRLAQPSSDGGPPPAEVPVGSRVFTNSHRLASVFRAADRGDEITVLLAYDVVLELGALVHHEHDQASALFGLIEEHYFGDVLWSCELPTVAPAGSFLILNGDDRVEPMFDLDSWRSSSDLLAEMDRVRIMQVRAAHTIEAPPLPEWFPRDLYCAPCPGACNVD